MTRIEVIQGVEGACVAINDYRVAGPKPWGGGRVIHTWQTDEEQILRAIPALRARLTAAEQEVERLREALRTIQLWPFDITGDCVADAQNLAGKALSESEGGGVMGGHFVSGGRNPLQESVCETCPHRNPDAVYSGYGWCNLRDCASVSSTGGCDWHPEFSADLRTRLTAAEQEVERLTAYADKLAEGLPCLPKDVEVLREANGRFAEENERLRKALKWYANEKHWDDDDWGVRAVVAPPEYGKPGTIAKAALSDGQEGGRE